MIFQIKVRHYSSRKNFSVIIAEDESREAIYKRLFKNYPQLQLSKTRKKDFKYYIVMSEITEQQSRQLKAKSHQCLECGTQYSTLDILNHRRFNDRFCSMTCKTEYFEKQNSQKKKAMGYVYAIIYDPTGQIYIGKTDKIFTTRWYEHVFEGKADTAFHQLLKTTPISKWSFKVLAEEHYSRLASIETKYIKKHMKDGKCLNMTKGSK